MLPVTPLANTLLAPRAGLEPAHGLINSQVPSQLGYLGKTPPVKSKSPGSFGSGAVRFLNYRQVSPTPNPDMRTLSRLIGGCRVSD